MDCCAAPTFAALPRCAHGAPRARARLCRSNAPASRVPDACRPYAAKGVLQHAHQTIIPTPTFARATRQS